MEVPAQTTSDAAIPLAPAPPAKSKRLLSLDVLRGITVAGMVLVNNQGGHQAFSAVQHSAWNGLTPCDLVFPFFLFIMGISTFISLRKFQFQPSRAVLLKILRRTLLILLIGWAIHWFEYVCKAEFFPFQELRLTGVLPRIALCYCLASLVALYVRHKYVPWLIAVLLIGYAVLLLTGNGYNCDKSNILGIVDRYVLGEIHLYHKSPIDPEGLVGTISSLAQTLIGFCCGKILFDRSSLENRTLRLVVCGFVLMAVGFLLIDAFPLNKRIFSPTFVLVTCGLAAMLQATLIYFIDMRGSRSWCPFFEIFGVNPLFLYVWSELLAIVIGVLGAKPLMYGAILQICPEPYVASLIYSVAFVLVMALCGWPLYRKKIYIKI